MIEKEGVRGKEKAGAKDTDSISLVIFVNVHTPTRVDLGENSVETKSQDSIAVSDNEHVRILVRED